MSAGLKHFLAALSLLAAGCGSQKSPEAVQAVEKPAAKPEEKGPASEVSLDAKAMADARISVEATAQRPLPETVRATGRIALNEDRTWRVGAITDGRAVRVHVNVGDMVRQGQVLALLHSHEVHEGRASFQKAKSELARWKALESHSRRTRDRLKNLLALKAAAVEQLDHAENELRAAEEGIKQAQAEVERTKTHLVDFLDVGAEDNENHEGGKHGDEDLIPVKSPAAGVILTRAATVGAVVQPGAEMFVVTDTSALWMIAAAAEEDLGKLRIGMPVNVTVKAHPGRVFRGRLSKFGEQLDPETRTIQARVELANPGGLLKPEMYAAAEFETAASRAALLAPELALQEVKGQTVLFVERAPGRFEAVAVETGRTAGGMVEISQGLEPGARVAVKGAFLLKSQLLRKSLDEE